jgi:hypothetical protein
MGSTPPRVSASETAPNRRTYMRRQRTFPATYSQDGQTAHPAYGLDLSGGGLRLLTREPLATDSKTRVSLIAVLDGREVHLEACPRWSATVTSAAGTRFRHGLRLAAIADADWDFLMRLSLDEAGILPGKPLTDEQRDLLLPAEKQQRIVEQLAIAGRVTYRRGAKLPALRYVFESCAVRDGERCYLLTVSSATSETLLAREHRTRVLSAIENDQVRILP